jgi:hypothetical protein
MIKIYKTIILPVVLYGCETWSLILREEHRLKCLRTGAEENILTKREEVARGWRKLHNEEFHKLYASPNVIVIKPRRMRWVRHVASMGYEKCIQIFGQKT